MSFGQFCQSFWWLWLVLTAACLCADLTLFSRMRERNRPAWYWPALAAALLIGTFSMAFLCVALVVSVMPGWS